MKQNHTTGAIVDGNLRTINEFSELDRKLDFLCPKCKEPLILRLFKTRNQSHFAHKPDSNCTGAQESAYHLLAKEVLKETKTLYFPEVNFEIESDYIYYEIEKFTNGISIHDYFKNKVLERTKNANTSINSDFLFELNIVDKISKKTPESILEKIVKFIRIETEDDEGCRSVFYSKYGFIPDAVGYCFDKNRIEREIIIEFFYTHKVGEDKLSKIKRLNLPCVEIDISKLELDREVFKKYLANKDCKSVYLNNPKADEIKSNFVKTIEEKVKEEVEKISSEIKEKEDKISELMKLNYVQIPSSLSFGFSMEKFCSRNSEKKAEYKTSRFYRDSIVKDIIEGGWNLSGDYDRHDYTERIIGMTLHKDKEMRKIKYIGQNFKDFFSDYYRKMWTSDGCKNCDFFKEVDLQNKFCGSPEVKPFVDPFKEIEKLIDSKNNLDEAFSSVKNKSTNEKITGKSKFDRYNIENREDFFK